MVTESQRWFFLIITLALMALVYLLAPILSPFLIGALLAYLCDPAADRLEAVGCSRTVAVVIVFTCLSAVMAALVLLLLPKLSQQVRVLVSLVPTGLELVDTRLLPWLEQALGVDTAALQFESVRSWLVADWQQAGDLMKRLLGGISRSGVALAAWLANLVLIPVVTFYLLRDWDLMMAKLHRLLPRNVEGRVSLWANECDEVLGAFVKGQLIVMMALGGIYAVGLWLVGLDLALLIGMLAGLASIVPYMGFIIGFAAAAVAAFMQFQDPSMLLWVGAVFGVGQALEGMLLTPLLVGDRIGLHPVAVIFAIMAGGQLFGFVGVLLALPVAAVIMVLLRHLHEGYKSSSLYSQYRNESVEHDNNNEQSA